MSLTSTTFRMEQSVKDDLRDLLAELGLDMSTFFVMTAKQALRERAIPFRVCSDSPNAETRKAMQDTLDGVGLSRPFYSVAELMEDLDADD